MGATDQAARLRAAHQRVTLTTGAAWCALCRQDWPCDVVALLDTERARVAERDALLRAGLDACTGYRLTLPETTLHQACYEAFFEDFERDARVLTGGPGDG